MFGGFILHFLLCNFLTVLLRPSFEAPVETARDLLKRDITPFYIPGGDKVKQVLAASSDPDYKEISQILVIPKDFPTWYNMYYAKVQSTGKFACVGTYPMTLFQEDFRMWSRSSETIGGTNPYMVHLSNKKWPLKKVYVDILDLY